MTNKVFKALMALCLALAVMAAPVCEAQAAALSGSEIDARAEEIVSGMTLNEKISQMMIVMMPRDKAVSIQKKNQYGGYILFGPDFRNTTKSKLKKRLKKCQKVSKVKMLMCVDEEGGTVVRASMYSHFRKSRFRSPRSVYRSSGYKGITKDTKKKDRFLKSLGLNCNFAPVADVPYGSGNFIYQRGFSTSAKKTSKFIAKTLKQMKKDDVVSCMKHFPGYGGNGDTHGQIIKDKRKKSTFKKRDLKPFEQGIKSDADMIMMSHIVVKAFDRKNPASLSKSLHKYLRNDMGFNGVIITDGLGMEGVRKFVGGSSAKAAVRAVKAGNDMLCVTSSRVKVHKEIKKAVKKGTISRDQIDASVKRIIKMKLKRGIIK